MPLSFSRPIRLGTARNTASTESPWGDDANSPMLAANLNPGQNVSDSPEASDVEPTAISQLRGGSLGSRQHLADEAAEEDSAHDK